MTPRPRLSGRGTGFTLVEVMIVVAVITLLSAMVIPSGLRAYMIARDARRVGDLRVVQIALETYFVSHFEYPGGTDGFLVDSTASVGWIEALDAQGYHATNSMRDPIQRTATDFAAGYAYFYCISANKQVYVLNARLEAGHKKMTEDQGTCENRYEIGPGAANPTMCAGWQCWGDPVS